MKIGAWGKTTFIIYTITNFSLSFSGYYRSSRSLTRLAVEVGRQHNNIRLNQQKLLHAFKETLIESKPVKPDTLHSIASAIGNKTKYKPYLKNQKIIKQSIDQFDQTTNFPWVLLRALEGTVNNDSAHFNGAMAQIKVALDKVHENKTVLEFNKLITDGQGKPLTEIDIITEDNDGQKAWHEVKSRNRIRSRDKTDFAHQQRIQKEQAKVHGINRHELIIIRKKS